MTEEKYHNLTFNHYIIRYLKKSYNNNLDFTQLKNFITEGLLIVTKRVIINGLKVELYKDITKK